MLWRAAGPRLIRLTTSIGAAALAAALLWPLRPALEGPFALPFKAGLVALFAFGAAAPLPGLLLLCGALPLAAVIGTGLALPWRGTQTAGALVMALLAGWFVRHTFGRRSDVPPAVQPPLLSLAVIVVVSALVAGWPWTRETALAPLGRYLEAEQRFAAVHAALHFLLGLGLVALTASIVRGRSGDARAVLRMLGAGVAGAAALNVLRFVEVVLATARPMHAAGDYLRWLRINTQYGDVNAAGSVFAMILVVLAGLASSGRWRAGWVAACAVTFGGMWLAGSRTAIAVSAVACAALAARGCIVPRMRARGRAAALVGGGLAALVVAGGALALVTSSRFTGNADPSSAWGVRREMLLRAGRMLADQPVFGVGAGRFYAESARYATQGTFGPENAHNTFAQIGAELGIAGLALFAWLLGAALRPSLRRSRRTDEAPLAVFVVTALGVYLLTGLGGHPLVVFEASLPFWILLGVSAGTDEERPPHRAGRLTALAVALLALGSLPDRIPAQLEMPREATRWYDDGEVRYRRVGEADRISVPRPASGVTIPVRLSAAPADTPYADVVIRVDGTEIARTMALADRWTRVRVIFPRQPGYEARRIELRLERHAPGAALLVGRLEGLN